MNIFNQKYFLFMMEIVHYQASIIVKLLLEKYYLFGGISCLNHCLRKNQKNLPLTSLKKKQKRWKEKNVKIVSKVLR